MMTCHKCFFWTQAGDLLNWHTYGFTGLTKTASWCMEEMQPEEDLSNSPLPIIFVGYKFGEIFTAETSSWCLFVRRLCFFVVYIWWGFFEVCNISESHAGAVLRTLFNQVQYCLCELRNLQSLSLRFTNISVIYSFNKLSLHLEVNALRCLRINVV